MRQFTDFLVRYWADIREKDYKTYEKFVNETMQIFRHIEGTERLLPDDYQKLQNNLLRHFSNEKNAIERFNKITWTPENVKELLTENFLFANVCNDMIQEGVDKNEED